MAATFGSPVSAVLLAIELLLFEYRPRSLIPVALAAAAATGGALRLRGHAPAFAMPDIAAAERRRAGRCYVLLGALVGRRLGGGDHGGLRRSRTPSSGCPSTGCGGRRSARFAVGIIGYFAPRTLGVGYDNIDADPRRGAGGPGAARRSAC